MVKNYEPKKGEGKYFGKALSSMRNEVFGQPMNVHLLRTENKMEHQDAQARISAAEAKRKRKAEKAQKILDSLKGNLALGTEYTGSDPTTLASEKDHWGKKGDAGSAGSGQA